MFVGASLIATVMPSRDASAQKVSKETMQYQDKPSGAKECGNCAQFIPDNGCQIVEGTVSPHGFCIAWRQKS